MRLSVINVRFNANTYNDHANTQYWIVKIRKSEI